MFGLVVCRLSSCGPAYAFSLLAWSAFAQLMWVCMYVSIASPGDVSGSVDVGLHWRFHCFACSLSGPVDVGLLSHNLCFTCYLFGLSWCGSTFAFPLFGLVPFGAQLMWACICVLFVRHGLLSVSVDVGLQCRSLLRQSGQRPHYLDTRTAPEPDLEKSCRQKSNSHSHNNPI